MEKATILELAIPFGNQAGQMGVHGPSQVSFADRAEFSGGHEDDVGDFRQLVQGSRLEQITSNRLNADQQLARRAELDC